MKKNNILNNGIPVSVSLNPTLEAENFRPRKSHDKKRLLLISLFAFLIGTVICAAARFLVYLIDLITNISFYHHFSFVHTSPTNNSLGIIVIIVPVIGGIIVGLMALYGSKAIRGHGIPEAMEQILTNKSKIRPSITYLKPLSAAISIGTGGPFGAEGPIIATGGAFGSTVGQLLKISHNERKILLAAGATAGMSAIFGTPVAAIFLAVELLLFEFSPRSLIPVSIACITGAAGHHLLFGQGPVFAMPDVAFPNNSALLTYCLLGIAIGFLSAGVTKAVYFIEDLFEKLPVHWMWWPAIGGLGVGLVGYFYPRTLGVGYENITDVLAGKMAIGVLFSLCVMKFISWAVALGSGTSGGTLAPLLTIGGAAGILIGSGIIYFFPDCGITLPLSALVGMSAMFAGASRALLTSIIFSFEATGQSNALLPLLAACIASYFVSFFLMKNTIMTEKIARRGVKTPYSYEPDILEKISIAELLKGDELLLSEENTIGEVSDWLLTENKLDAGYFAVVSNAGEFRGIINVNDLKRELHHKRDSIGVLIRKNFHPLSADQSLRDAVERMAKDNSEILPVISADDKKIFAGLLSYKDIIGVYKEDIGNHEMKQRQISIRRGSLKILIRGKKLVTGARTKFQG
jgi:CIC family chloride channel protein